MADLPPFDPFKALEEIRREGDAGAAKLSQKLSQHPARDVHEQNQVVSSTLAGLAGLAGGPVAHALAPARVKEEDRKNYSFKSCAYARVEGGHGHACEHARTDPARPARVASIRSTHCEDEDFSKFGPARVLEGEWREWRRLLTALSPEHPPCPGYRAGEWAKVHARALTFLDQFGEQAEALGWTAPRLFGVHPEIGIVRVDHCGALVLGVGGAPHTMTATEICFGHLTHRHKPYQPKGVPIWNFGRLDPHPEARPA